MDFRIKLYLTIRYISVKLYGGAKPVGCKEARGKYLSGQNGE